jgi:hypothetical protein
MRNLTIIAALLGVFALGAAPAQAQDACSLNMGDVDGTGDVNVYDGYTILSHLYYGSGGTFHESVADVNGDGNIDISDAQYIWSYVYRGGPAPVSSVPRGDANGDGAVDITDLSVLGQWLWGGRGEVCVSGADMNGDGEIDISDFITLAQTF